MSDVDLLATLGITAENKPNGTDAGVSLDLAGQIAALEAEEVAAVTPQVPAEFVTAVGALTTVPIATKASASLLTVSDIEIIVALT